jgi:hypothetical protein
VEAGVRGVEAYEVGETNAYKVKGKRTKRSSSQHHTAGLTR